MSSFYATADLEPGDCFEVLIQHMHSCLPILKHSLLFERNADQMSSVAR